MQLHSYSAHPSHQLVESLISSHAAVRRQQRGIPRRVVELLLDFGEERHIGHGATMLSFPKRSRDQMRKCLDKADYTTVASCLDAYAVVGSRGVLMTVGHRYRHVRIKD